MKRRLLKGFLFCTIVLTISTDALCQTKGFEDNTTQGTWQSGGGSGLAFSISSAEARTGAKALSSVSSTTSNRYVGSPAENDYTLKRTVHMIFYAKANFTASDMYLSIYAGSERNKVSNLTINNTYQRYSNYYYDANARTGTYFRFGSTNTYKSPTNNTIYIDDVVVYTVDGNVPETDLSAPNAPATVSGNFTGGKALLTWTSGGDNAAAGTTGVQATMTLKYTGSGTPTAPVLNQQANYSVSDVIATNWVVVKNNSADAAIDEDMGAISSTTDYAIYHRDLAYNWSTGSLVTVNTTLPVKLTSFKATSQADGIGLTWTTASENNTAKFIVEKVDANGSSTTVAEIAAAGNSNSAINYAAKDKNVTAGETCYYRLKTVDNDGVSQTSELVSAKFGLAMSANSLTIFPNPASNQVTLNFQKSENASKLFIVDSKGAIVQKMDIAAGIAEQTVDVSSLKTGVYIVQIQSNKGRVSSKFFKN